MNAKELHTALSQAGRDIEQARELLEERNEFSNGRAYEKLTTAQKQIHSSHFGVLIEALERPLPYLSVRTNNWLKAIGFDEPITFNSLLIWLDGKSDNELLRTPNFGRKSLNELKTVFKAEGLTWPLPVAYKAKEAGK